MTRSAPYASVASRCSRCGAAATLSTPLTEGPSDFNVPPGTRHHILLNSNEAPLESDLKAVDSALSKADVRLAFLDEEISRLRDRLVLLEEERASVSNYRARNIGIISPLRRMPPEVVCEIFSWTLPSADVALQSPFSLNSSPWLLTHISSRWRAISLSSPSLWSHIVIRHWHSYPPSLRVVEAQIHRAHKLEIQFYGEEDADSRPQIEMFKLLTQHSSRWGKLTLRLTSKLAPLLSSLRDQLPSLSQLSLRWDGPDSQTGVDFIDCFQTAPSLHDVGIYSQYRAVPVLLPAHQLTRCHLDGAWETHHGILAVAQNLVEARLIIDFDEAPWPDSAEIIDVLCLRRLFVSPAEFLNYLKAPALQQIALDVVETDAPSVFHHLESLILRSGCTLQKLSLAGYPPASETIDILRKYPSITALTFIIHNERDASSEAANTLISHLTIPPHTPPHAVIAPHLSDICIGCENETSIDHAAYLKMLRSRWDNEHCTLKAASLVTHLGLRPDPATLSGLEALRHDGLDLLVFEGSDAQAVMHSWV